MFCPLVMSEVVTYQVKLTSNTNHNYFDMITCKISLCVIKKITTSYMCNLSNSKIKGNLALYGQRDKHMA